MSGVREDVGAVLAALQAKREADRLLRHGLLAATHEAVKRIESAKHDGEVGFVVNDVQVVEVSEDLILLVAFKDAVDVVVDLYEQAPGEHPDGASWERAFAKAEKRARRRYARGKCALCKGPARPCAARHARGKSYT